MLFGCQELVVRVQRLCGFLGNKKPSLVNDQWKFPVNILDLLYFHLSELNFYKFNHHYYYHLMKRVLPSFSSLSSFSTSITQFTSQSESIKLSKWISQKSLCSRRQAEEFIKLGLIRVDGKRVFENMMIPYTASMKAFTTTGIKVQKPLTKLWMMNKPRGYICTHNDEKKRPTIYSLVPPFFNQYGHIMSVGRLDYNSEGLLLLTNDPVLKNLLQNPETNLSRFYRVKVHGKMNEKKLDLMNREIVINGEKYGPLRATVDRSLTTNTWLNVELMRGKNRQIRKVMQKCDLEVNKLIREKYGPYKLNSLKHRQIVEVEVSKGLDRKLKITKAKAISGSETKCLIEIDLRKEAIEYVKQERRKIQKKQDKAIEEKMKKIEDS